MEFEYILHGTTSLIGFFDVAAGRMEMPYLNSTRTEEDFVEVLVRFAAQACVPDVELGKKRKTGILKNMESRADFLHDPSRRIRLSILRNTVPG